MSSALTVRIVRFYYECSSLGSNPSLWFRRVLALLWVQNVCYSVLLDERIYLHQYHYPSLCWMPAWHPYEAAPDGRVQEMSNTRIQGPRTCEPPVLEKEPRHGDCKGNDACPDLAVLLSQDWCGCAPRIGSLRVI